MNNNRPSSFANCTLFRVVVYDFRVDSSTRQPRRPRIHEGVESLAMLAMLAKDVDIPFGVLPLTCIPRPADWPRRSI